MLYKKQESDPIRGRLQFDHSHDVSPVGQPEILSLGQERSLLLGVISGRIEQLESLKGQECSTVPERLDRMTLTEFSSFIHGEISGLKEYDRNVFFDKLIARIKKLFPDAIDHLKSITQYLEINGNQYPETFDKIIGAIKNPSSGILFNVYKKFQQKLNEYMEIVKSNDHSSKEKQEALIHAVEMLTNKYKILIEVLHELNIEPQFLIDAFYNLAKQTLIGRTSIDRELKIVEYARDLRDHSIKRGPKEHHSKVIGLLGDMEFLTSFYMDFFPEGKAGFAYLSRLTMMTQEEHDCLRAELSTTDNPREHSRIRNHLISRAKAVRMIYKKATTTNPEEGIYVQALQKTKKYIEDHNITDEAILEHKFIRNFTELLREKMETDPEAESIFTDIYRRLIEPHIQDSDNFIITDTGNKGTLATLACALIEIFSRKEHTNKRASVFLYGARHDLDRIIPSFFLEEPVEKADPNKGVHVGHYSKVESLPKIHTLTLETQTRQPYLAITPARMFKFFEVMHRIQASNRLLGTPRKKHTN